MFVIAKLSVTTKKCFTSWEYNNGKFRGLDSWPDTCKLGKRQSPINIRPPMSKADNGSFEIIFRGYELPFECEQVSLKNDGRTAKFTITEGNSPGFILYDKDLYKQHKYKFANGHFHWGSNDKIGSEHHIDGKIFPLELHLVHFNEAIGSTLSEAVAANKPNSLSVLGITFKLSRQPNELLNPFFEALMEIQNEGDTVNIINQTSELSLKYFLPHNTNEFFQYFGSLTTPDCNEIVRWIVFKEPVQISKEQMQLFRRLTFQSSIGKRRLVNNYRPIQPLNGRVIF